MTWLRQRSASLCSAEEAGVILDAAWDQVCSTARSRLADPTHAGCTNLAEATIEGGHGLMLEAPAAVNAAIAEWLATRGLRWTALQIGWERKLAPQGAVLCRPITAKQ